MRKATQVATKKAYNKKVAICDKNGASKVIQYKNRGDIMCIFDLLDALFSTRNSSVSKSAKNKTSSEEEDWLYECIECDELVEDCECDDCKDEDCDEF